MHIGNPVEKRGGDSILGVHDRITETSRGAGQTKAPAILTPWPLARDSEVHTGEVVRNFICLSWGA